MGEKEMYPEGDSGRGISRRDFLKFGAGVAATLGTEGVFVGGH